MGTQLSPTEESEVEGGHPRRSRPTSDRNFQMDFKNKRRGKVLGLLTTGLLIGMLISWAFGVGHPAMKTRLFQVMKSESIPSGTWVSGPIRKANGYKTLIAQFSWADGFQMKNNNNYAIAWFDDPAGKQEVGLTQFGEGTIPYQNQVIQILAPYYQIQAKNTDSVAHILNAWAYLMSN